MLILIDTREKDPYKFNNIVQDKEEGGKIVSIPTRVQTLPHGDYAAANGRIVVERKTENDLWQTLTRGRERFARELESIEEDTTCDLAVIAVEQLLHNFPYKQIKIVSRTAMSWAIKYPKVHWRFFKNRVHAEAFTYRMLWMGVKKQCSE